MQPLSIDGFLARRTEGSSCPRLCCTSARHVACATELGKDGFHPVPDSAPKDWDAVERVLTILEDRHKAVRRFLRLISMTARLAWLVSGERPSASSTNGVNKWPVCARRTHGYRSEELCSGARA